MDAQYISDHIDMGQTIFFSFFFYAVPVKSKMFLKEVLTKGAFF